MSETLQTSVYMKIYWLDVFLIWNQSDYNGLYFTYWPQDDVWRPDIVLYNSNKAYEALGHKTIMVENYSDGWIRWFPMELFETSCEVEMTYFPFDVHTCELQFTPWSYTSVKLTSFSDTVGLESYSTNALWEILETSVEKRKVANVDVLSYKLKIQRKHLHEMLTLFVPVLLLTILDLFVFALPNGGDRSGYAVTVFLAFSVYFTIVDTVMPPNSEKISLFSIYLVIQTCQSTIITILSVLLTKVEFIDESTRIPRVLVFLVRISGACCRRKKAAEVYPLEHITKGETSEGNTIEKDLKETTEPATWTMVTDAVDKIASIVFTLVFIITTVIFFCVIILVPNRLK
ncbi:neuronal acetylcholine receptor subunit alpha-5-like [Mercenaria mercenaria]|uniref:neuronal acetylcholine receptor subunit alpha-5-like n=1 Tax=Mercenaria mercenaria TaxID=6596 RepID=UPI00234F389E|nr:neuronal acetylcholine receptor subunit alpha-5-like [Mercenaria mercenaria]